MRLSPTLPDYAAARSSFSWSEARAQLLGTSDGINIAHVALDRHLDTPTADRTAIRFLPREGDPVDISYRELAARANRFANLLATLGLQPGDGVYCLAHRIPDLYAAALGALKHGCVFTPLFPAFGPEPIRSTGGDRRARGHRYHRASLSSQAVQLDPQIPSVKQVLLIGDVEGGAEAPGCRPRP
jgi:acetyl-CoA synthetase